MNAEREEKTVGPVSEGTRRRPFFRVLQWGIVLLIFVLLGRMIWENWSQVKEAPFSARPFPLILSTFIYASSYFIQIWAWYFITVKVGIALPAQETLESWFFSQLGKYLPGKVWILLGRYYFYESKGKSRRAVTVALYFETITAIGASFLIFLASLAWYEEIRLPSLPRGYGWLFPLFFFTLVFLHPRLLERILNGLLRRFKKEPLSLDLSYLDILWVLLISIVAWGVAGVGFYLFVDSIYPVPPGYFLFLTGALAFSSTVGLIALFAPSGLGVREGVLVYLLSFLMVPAVGAVISVLTRLWLTLIEIGLIGVVYLAFQARKRAFS